VRVLVDTCVWSEVLRKKAGRPEVVEELRSLIQDDCVVLLGVVRQEVLSGIWEKRVFNRIERQMDPFPDLSLEKADYVSAAHCANQCRIKGIQGSAIDFLITAAAIRHETPIFTVDMDFSHFQKVFSGLNLHSF